LLFIDSFTEDTEKSGLRATLRALARTLLDLMAFKPEAMAFSLKVMADDLKRY
jgi:hypothetical protein